VQRFILRAAPMTISAMALLAGVMAAPGVAGATPALAATSTAAHGQAARTTAAAQALAAPTAARDHAARAPGTSAATHERATRATAAPAARTSTTTSGHAVRAGAWVGTWEAASAGVNELGCDNCTIRNIVHTSIAGTELRVKISNIFGTAPLQVAQATVALPSAPGSANVEPGTLTQVTFSGAASVTIAAGQAVWSDPIPLAIPANNDLLVSTYTPGDPTPFTWHPSAQEYSYYVSGSDQTDATSASAFPDTTGSWYLLTGVEVTGTAAPGAVVTFGDSITDGFQSTYDLDARWPNILADRLLALPPADQLGVLNAGIGGNRILRNGGNGFGPSGLSRFRRDVINQPGVRAVIILEGINDIQQTPHVINPNKIIAGLQKLIAMGHAAGLRVIGATLTPFEGWSTYNAQEKHTWQAVDNWIRTSHAYDAVIDFDHVTRDPEDIYRYLPAFDSGDHLHPNDAGYMAMGAAVNLADLGVTVPPGQGGPEIKSLSPNPASAGQVVTIQGSGFGDTQGAGYVQFTNVGTYWGAPGNLATFQIDSWSDKSITFTVPEPSGTNGVWYVSPGTTATVNVIDAAGAVSRTATLAITPTANPADYYDNVGTTPDTDQTCGNMDGDGFTYSANALAADGITPGGTVSSGGLTYTWPGSASCSPDNILADAQTVLLNGAGGQSTLGLLGSATTGPSTGIVLVHYSDGSTVQETVTFGDWAGAPVTGDTAVATMPYRNSDSGTSQQLTVYVFATQVPIDPSKTVVSVTLPDVGYSVAPGAAGFHIFALSLG
jgi:lysophospholipase L1-like esterase